MIIHSHDNLSQRRRLQPPRRDDPKAEITIGAAFMDSARTTGASTSIALATTTYAACRQTSIDTIPKLGIATMVKVGRVIARDTTSFGRVAEVAR